MKALRKNCCDGIYNSLDIHFTSACDNRCSHCVDLCYAGTGIVKPDVKKISDSIIENSSGIDDVLFLGGEPCLFLEELIETIEIIKAKTELKVFVTSAMPKILYDNMSRFEYLLKIVDGFNISAQHHNEDVGDAIRRTVSKYDRQEFYRSLPYKEKIRINLNIVKPYLYTREDIAKCLTHYDSMGFNSIKLSEIQHGKEYFIRFEDIFNVKYGSPYFFGCQKYIDVTKIEDLKHMKTPLLLKRSCFACEETLNPTLLDGLKVITKLVTNIVPKNKFGVIYEDGTLSKGWR